MMAHDDDLQDAIALLALGVLPEPEASAVAAHLNGCAECRAAYAELRGTADLVGFAAEFAPGQLDEVSAARLKGRVMAAVRAEPPVVRRAETPPATTPTAKLGPGRAERPWFAYLAAAAALVLAVLTGSDDLALRAAHERDARTVAEQHERAVAADARVRALDERLALVIAPESKHFAVPGGEVVINGGRVIIAMPHLPAPPPGKIYQAWTLARGAKTVAPSVTFAPDADGLMVIELPERSAGLAAVAVTLEPLGGSKVPTAAPAFVRKLS